MDSKKTPYNEGVPSFPVAYSAEKAGVLTYDVSFPCALTAVAAFDDIPRAFLLGCKSHSPPLVQKSLASLNKLVIYNACSAVCPLRQH
jgi:hypothetical protein